MLMVNDSGTWKFHCKEGKTDFTSDVDYKEYNEGKSRWTTVRKVCCFSGALLEQGFNLVPSSLCLATTVIFREWGSFNYLQKSYNEVNGPLQRLEELKNLGTTWPRWGARAWRTSFHTIRSSKNHRFFLSCSDGRNAISLYEDLWRSYHHRTLMRKHLRQGVQGWCGFIRWISLGWKRDTSYW